MSYEYARTNGSYGGLSMYHGLGDGKGKGKGKGPGHGGLMPFSKDGGRRESPFSSLITPSKARSQSLEQRSVQTAQRAERAEQRGERALTAGRDTAAQFWMGRSQQLEAKSERQADKAQQLRLPYTDVPLVPKGIVKQADEALYDTPVKIADQVAPLPPESTPTPTTAAPTVTAQVPITLPLMPPPLLYATGMPRPPQMPGGPPPMVMAQPRPFMGGRISPANAAAATAALAASYFLFF
jgi:hypothetical protein